MRPDLDVLTSKEGVRALGVAESFKPGMVKSVLTGVVMRGDFVIDGIVFDTATIGGLDAAESVIRLFKRLNRNDVHIIIIDGCIISWYNIVDLEAISVETGLPAICISFEEPTGNVEMAIRKLFPNDADKRLDVYRRLGKPREVVFPGGLRMYVRFVGIDYKAVRAVLKRFLREGKRPEPIRIARLIANAIINSPLLGLEAFKG